jgi:hemerythrin
VPIMNWTPALSVGVDSLDAQHKKWIDTVNRLFDAMKIGRGREILGPLLAEVVQFARMHFETEERAMLSAGYDGYAQHKAKHGEFLRRMTEMQKNHQTGNLTLSLKLMDTLRDWIVEHVQETDKCYEPCMTSKGIR